MKYKVKDINRLVYPILLNYLLNSIFEILDQAIVGHYSSQSFALVGIASSMIYAVTGAFGIMSTVFNIIAAERKGKKDEAGFESVFAINKMLTLLIGFLFFIIGCLGGKLFFRQVYGITGNDLIEMLSYFYPAAFTVVQNMLIFQYSAYYRNCFNTKITLYSTIVSTIVNLFFDYSLVFGCFGLPQLGTAGAAWGSVIGLFVGLFIYQIPYWRKHSPVIAKRMIEKNTIKQMFRLYPSFWGQEFLENTILVFVVSGIVSRMGTDKMAVYSLLGTVGCIVGLPVYAYAIAAQTYALQKRASGNKDEAKEYLKTGAGMAFLVIGIVCICCWIGKEQMLRCIISDTNIIQQAKKLLIFLFAIQLIKVPYQIYMSYLQGIGYEKLVFYCVAAGTIATSVGVLICGTLWKLSGIYAIMFLEYLILTWIYKGYTR